MTHFHTHEKFMVHPAIFEVSSIQSVVNRMTNPVSVLMNYYLEFSMSVIYFQINAVGLGRGVNISDLLNFYKQIIYNPYQNPLSTFPPMKNRVSPWLNLLGEHKFYQNSEKSHLIGQFPEIINFGKNWVFASSHARWITAQRRYADTAQRRYAAVACPSPGILEFPLEIK